MSKDNNQPKARPLATIDPKELKSIKVALKRNDVASTSQVQPLIRTLDDPTALRVNLSGVRSRPIFYREDVLPNVHEVTNEQMYSKHERGNNDPPKNGEPQPGPSRRSENSGSLFGDYINSSPPFELPPEEEDTWCRHKQKDYHSKVPHRSRSRSKESKSRSSSKERHETVSRKPSRRRSPSDDGRYREKERNYKKPYRKDRSPPLRPGEYRPKKRKSTSRSSSNSPERYSRHYSAKIYKSREDTPSSDGKHRSYKRRSKSDSPSRSPYRSKKMEPKSRRYSKSPEAHRRHVSPRSKHRGRRTPTRPGEYRPRRSFSKDRHVTHSPPLRPGEYRPRKRSNSPPLRPGEYRPPKHRNYYPATTTDYYYYEGLGAGGLIPQFGHPSVPPIRQVYIPYPIYPIRPPFHPPFNRPPRPPLVYNNRPIPKLVPPPPKEGTSNDSRDESAHDKDAKEHK